MKLVEKNERLEVSLALLFIFLSLLVLKLSGFSASVLVDIQNYAVRTMILDTSGMGTLGAIGFAAKPFLPVFLSLIFFVIGLSFLVVCNIRESRAGSIVGALGAVLAVILFPTVWGVFLALSIFVASFSTVLSGVYIKEIKKWVGFRLGSRTSGRALFIFNIIVAAGLFFSVLAGQAAYEDSFRTELTKSMMSIAMSLPGASLIPSSVLTQRVDSAIADSPLFTAYIRWLPVTTAFSAWIILELLRNLILSNISGAFTYIMRRRE